MKQPFCALVDRLGFQPLIVPGKPICLVQKPLCFATSAMLNVTEVKQRCAGRDGQQSEPVNDNTSETAQEGSHGGVS
jgi:hypothetical protein